MKDSTQIFLCAARRTAVGSLSGGLSTVSAPALAAGLIRNLLQETALSADSIDEVILGCVLTAGIGQAPARQALIHGGLPNTAQALTVNKVCSSGLKAIMLAADGIALGRTEAAIAGGMENMSLSPYLLPQLRSGARLGNANAIDSIVNDGLWDVYNAQHMGSCAELCARTYSISRDEQDSYAELSYRRALDAIAAGHFKHEIDPVTIHSAKKEAVISTDEEPSKVNFDKLRTLKPVFEKDGTVTAANASSINDGASLMLVCTERYASQHGLTPLARILAQGYAAQAPEWFTTAPVKAIQHALAKADKTVKDVDLFEINEAFSAVAIACQRDLGIEQDRLNVSGGAVALGHPIGASGARILTTLLHAMRRLELKLGVVGICNGGGEATAMVVERVQ
jgi:acetyl-CoA C-acetyltransferase